MVQGKYMSYISFIKNNFTRVPYRVGQYVSYLPYGYRPGISRIYKQRKHDISSLSVFDQEEYKSFVFPRMKHIAVNAYKNIPFYKELYTQNDVNPERFTSFEDLTSLPIVCKSDLQSVPLEFRSNLNIDKSIANTGGSSGQPLSFYIQSDSVAHEWAHMHTIWGKLGYKQSDLKIVFAGRADVRGVVDYDAVRHQLTVDIYKSPKQIADTLYKVFNKFKPKYLHGYPSAIFDFIIWLEVSDHPLLEVFKNNIKGIFLGSEYPHPQLREKVERILKCNSVSWYGHTERAVLAYEKSEKYSYSPFPSYGFSEAVDLNRDQVYELIGTSYYNFASPLIRYNTNDLIEPKFTYSILTEFKISQGRSGEYVTDINGNKVYLTALLFGRHHEIFNYVQHIQIKQISMGKVRLYITTDDRHPEAFLINKMDLNNVNIEFEFKIISSPIKTNAAKVPLLIR